MRGLIYLASRDKVDVDTFNKGIQYALEKLGNLESRNLALKEKQYQILKAIDTRALGTSLLIIPELRVLVLTKRHVGSENEIVIIIILKMNAKRSRQIGKRLPDLVKLV